ncbi:MAG: hypothetical protein JRH01_09815 [Deltaproteobacteria bacterium]|nr:hypothetical protein [Deltaproteobacteria bacterium]MBW2393282.1 hypothetical protein [Deltaproteobacteria bacterium]
MMRGASGLAVLPSLLAAERLGLGSSTLFWVLVALVWFGGSAVLGGWLLRRGRPLFWWVGHALGGIVLAFGLAAFHAWALGAEVTIPPVYRTLAYDLDAGVALDPILHCEAVLQQGQVLASPGAHPRFGAPQDRLWFDAPGSGGRRQLHFIDPDSREVRCWTCGEAGNNVRPVPNPIGEGVLFESDRDGALGLFSAETRERTRGRRPSRRIIPGDAPGAFPIYEAGGRGMVWSTAKNGAFSILTAALVVGHGGLSLGSHRPLVAGGLDWVAPLAWSLDARSLVYARGAGPDAFEGWWIDPATGQEEALGPLAGAAAVSFSRDGRSMVLASEEGNHAGPAGLGFVLARMGGARARAAGRSQLRIGTPGEALVRLDLGPVADWGAPTGVALPAGGGSLVLGQWRLGKEGREERLILLIRSCREAL